MKIVNLFCNPNILREFLLGCPKKIARMSVLVILKLSINFVYKNEEECIVEYFSKENTEKIPSLIYLVNNFVKQLNFINRNNCGEYFGVLLEFSKLRTS